MNRPDPQFDGMLDDKLRELDAELRRALRSDPMPSEQIARLAGACRFEASLGRGLRVASPGDLEQKVLEATSGELQHGRARAWRIGPVRWGAFAAAAVAIIAIMSWWAVSPQVAHRLDLAQIEAEMAQLEQDVALAAPVTLPPADDLQALALEIDQLALAIEQESFEAMLDTQFEQLDRDLLWMESELNVF